jgi:hypothetical protein
VVPVGLAGLLLVLRPVAGPVHDHEVARGAHLWRSGGSVLVLDGPADSARVLDGLRRSGVRGIDLVVARRGSKDVAALLADLRARVHVGAIAAPAGNHIRDATAVSAVLDVRVGRLVVHLVPHGGGLDAHL